MDKYFNMWTANFPFDKGRIAYSKIMIVVFELRIVQNTRQKIF